MLEKNSDTKTIDCLTELSSEFDANRGETAIILAAGHGKRIKSKTSKMLHKIWEISTVERVYNACAKGLSSANITLVVGIKARDVVNVIGKRANTQFCYQQEQNGTGHAVQVGIDIIKDLDYDGVVYVLPGDMGLIDENTIAGFRKGFMESNNEMMVLTGKYKGLPKDNSYGRIVRVKNTDINGDSAGEDEGKVIEIIEQKDILSLPDNEPYIAEFNGKKYGFEKTELIDNNEYNSGVFAFRYKHLKRLIGKLGSDNAQNEIYVTDLISLFNRERLSVGAVSSEKQYVLMGFNNKSVLHKMDDVARSLVYDKLKDIIEIAAPDDFFIHEDVAEEIIRMDKQGVPLDIRIGKGVYLGKGAKLNYNLNLDKNSIINGDIHLGKNVFIGEGAELSCFPGQKMVIEDGVEILRGNLIKGDTVIGDHTRIEAGVKVTGSDLHPTRIGSNVLIKGMTYIYGSTVEDEIFIEHSVILKKRVERLLRKDGKPQPVRFYLPMPEGIDAVEDL